MFDRIRTAWRPELTAFVLVWLGLAAFGRDRMFRDPGTLWHTVVGERIVDSGRLIRTDPFSCTMADRPWIAQQWLGECAMAIAHRMGGLDALLLGTAVILAAVFAWITGRLLRAGLGGPLAGLLVLVTIGASSYHFMPRPHVATIALLALCYGLLLDVESGRRRAGWVLCALPVMMVAWTNTHGGALGGLATIVLVLVGWLAWPRQVAPRARTVPWMIGAAGCLCGAAVFVNPYGAQLPRVWLDLSAANALPQLIVEHAPMRWLSVEGAMTASLAFIYLLVLAAAWHARPRVSWFIPLAWLVLAATRVRHGPLFAVTAVLAIAEMLPLSTIPARLESRGSVILGGAARRSWTWATRSIAAGLVLAALGMQAAGIRVPVVGAGWARLKPTYWPVAATDALESVSVNQDQPTVFNDVRYGGYLIYRMPKARVFIDDRCELYGDQRLMDYMAMHRDPGATAAEVSRTDYALLRAGTKLERHLSNQDEWRIVHRDATAVLLQRLPDLVAADVDAVPNPSAAPVDIRPPSAARMAIPSGKPTATAPAVQ